MDLFDTVQVNELESLEDLDLELVSGGTANPDPAQAGPGTEPSVVGQ